ncbi:lysophospholipid acyltransferase family protein [Olivibacter sitiensis]|uniref:lysophospholipid acyltransferase family protein n=1 Tax=Olivibacter sitiensis TaxID=376470 RepID=UPI0003F7BEC7|nr:lysophospholipid acyltransferase family protein [Olivibacter sitiensis]
MQYKERAKRYVGNCVYLLGFAPIYLLSLMPYGLLHATVGKSCYFLAYRLFRYRYSVVVQNLSRSLPDKPYAEIRRLAKGFYAHFACLAVEMIKSFSISRKRMLDLVQIENPELLLHYHKQNRHMVALLGHYGNWESLNALPTLFPFQVNVLYKPLSNKMMDRMMRWVRTRFGANLIPAQSALRYLLRHKGEAQLSLFIADQFPGQGSGCQVDFLHQRTTMFDGPEKLSRATNAVVLYVELKKKEANNWRVRFSLITEDAVACDKGEITRQFSNRLQQTIRENPVYWLWSHKRWKC